MKNILFSTILSFCLLPLTTQAAHDPSYKKCSFACEEIPYAKDVMYSWGTANKTQLNSNKLSILVWNLYKGRKDEFVKTFALLGKNRDIIMLSEATTDAPVSTSMSAIPNYGWDFAAGFLMKNQVATGTAVGSYAKSIEPRYYRTKDVEPFVKSPKATAIAEYAIPGRSDTVLALSIHGINWDGDDAMIRQLEMMMPDILAHKGPIIFAGDFNFKNENRLKLAIQILGRAGLKRVTWENPKKKKQLDDAFTRGVTVKKARFINEYIDKGSDHPAIDLQVEVNP